MTQKKQPTTNRRTLLKTLATGGTAALLAGCQDQNTNNTNGNQTNQNGTENNDNDNENGNAEEYPSTNVRMDIRNTGEKQNNNPIYANYNTPHQQDTLTHKPEETYQQHKNVYNQLEQIDPTLQRYLPSLRDDEKEEHSKTTGTLMVDGYERFSEENWLEADPQDSVRLAIRYLQSLDQHVLRNRPDRVEEYTTALTQAFEQEHPEYDIHASRVSNSEGWYGGIVHIENNDTLYLLEHVLSGLEEWDEDQQLDYVIPKIENSEYFREDGSERSTHHPLRFGEDSNRERTRGVYGSDFEEAKTHAARVLLRMNVPNVVSTNTTEIDTVEDSEGGFVHTTGYLSNFIESLRFYNDEDYDNNSFDTLRAQAALTRDLAIQDENYVIGGSVDEPWIARIDDDNLIDEIWKDEDGDYDNLIDEIDEYEDSINITSHDYSDMDEALDSEYQLENLEDVNAL